MATTEQRSHAQLVTEDRQTGVVVTLTNGDRGNYLGLDELHDLGVIIDHAQDAGKRWLAFRQKGRDFCLGRAPEATGPAVRNALIGTVQRLQSLDLLTVAAADGGCTGFGVGLFALTDLSLATERTWFQFPEILDGAAPAIVASWLYDRVPLKQGLYWTATGARFTADDAVRFGLATLVVPQDQLKATMERTLAVLDQINPEQLRKDKSVALAMSATARDLTVRRAMAMQWFR